MSSEEEYEEEAMLLADGFDDCIIGLCSRANSPDVMAYDISKMVAKLMVDGMTQEEAIEWFEFNILSAYMGEGTPVYIDTSVDADDFSEDEDE